MTGLWFAYLEDRGYRRGCHPTLSRDIRLVLGPWGCWVFAVLGPYFTKHLLDLKEELAATEGDPR